MKHEREILLKLANKEIKKVDAQAALDLSKTGAANYLLNVSLEILQEVGTSKIEKLLK